MTGADNGRDDGFKGRDELFPISISLSRSVELVLWLIACGGTIIFFIPMGVEAQSEKVLAMLFRESA